MIFDRPLGRKFRPPYVLVCDCWFLASLIRAVVFRFIPPSGFLRCNRTKEHQGKPPCKLQSFKYRQVLNICGKLSIGRPLWKAPRRSIFLFTHLGRPVTCVWGSLGAPLPGIPALPARDCIQRHVVAPDPLTNLRPPLAMRALVPRGSLRIHYVNN